jgi:virulence-associated protein VapD
MMFAIAFDLNVEKADEHHPRRSKQAYADIAVTLSSYGFSRVQGSVYASDHEDLGRLFEAIAALKGTGWFGRCVKNIRAFRMEQGSDFTAIVEGVG